MEADALRASGFRNSSLARLLSSPRTWELGEGKTMPALLAKNADALVTTDGERRDAGLYAEDGFIRLATGELPATADTVIDLNVLHNDPTSPENR
jgi:hypothetical protein